MSTPVVVKEKQTCPHCQKKVLHLKPHIRNMHAVAPPLAAPEPELVVVEKIPEPEIVVAKEPTPPPSPPPEKETFAEVAAKVAPVPFAALSIWKPIVPRQTVAPSGPIDVPRFVNNVFKFRGAGVPGRKSEWTLLTSLWQDTPARFQISKVHSNDIDPRPRITITVWRDEAHSAFSIYHIYMNTAVFAKATHVDGCESTGAYRIVDFMEKV